MASRHLLKLLINFVWLIFITFGASLPAKAESLFQFHTLAKKDGLSSSVVFDIAQDRNGFIWFATEDGLQKYDGFNFVTYRYNRLNKNSISNNVVRTLLVDNSGALWVGTNNGLNLYSRKTNDFEIIADSPGGDHSPEINQIRALHQSDDGIIWIGTSAGLSAIDPDTKQITHYKHHKVRAIFEDNHKQLWIGTLGNGLYLFNKVTHNFEPVPVVRDVSELEGTAAQVNQKQDLLVVDIFQDALDRILIASWGKGVFQVNENRRKLIEHPLDLPSQYVRQIHQDRKGKLWFGTKNGVLVFEPAEKMSRKIMALENSDTSLKNNNITSIFQGDDDTIWLGTFGGGVSRFFPSSKRFENYGLHPVAQHGLIDPVVYSIYENNRGKIWLGTESGKLSLFDPESKLFKHFPLSDFDEISGYSIFAMHEMEDKALLLGTNGLFKYWYEENRLEKIVVAGEKSLSSDSPVLFIQEDDKNRLWIGIKNCGLVVFDVDDKGRFNEITDLHIKVNDPVALVFTSSEELIFATENSGIFELSLNDNASSYATTTRAVTHSQGLGVLAVNLDWNKKLWIGTLTNGIKLLSNHEISHGLDEQNGLPNNNVYSIIPDEVSNKVWATTNSGMVSIHPDTLELTHYTASDGLQNDEFNSSGIKSTRGYLYFAGINGFNRFYPNIIEKSLYVRPPGIINLSIANSNVLIDSQGILKESTETLKSLSLNYDQTPFSFEFTSPQFVKPKELEFRYRLQGLNDEWIYAAKNVRRATYTNIDSGDYIFELQVGSSSAQWNESIRRLELFIRPPWWATSVAKLFYSFCLLSVLSLVFYLLYKKMLKEREIQLAVQESEERLKLSLWGSGYEFWDWNIETQEVSRSNEFKKIEILHTSLSKDLHQLASYIHPNDLQMVRESLLNHIAGKTRHFEMCYRIMDENNGWRWIQDRGKVVAVNTRGSALRMSGTQRDITDRKEKDEQFEMLGQAFKSTSDGVWIRDHEWRLIECNPAYERITGFSLLEKKGEVLWYPKLQHQSENMIQRIRDSIDEKGSWQGEVWAERKDNEPFPQKLTIDTLHDDKGRVRYYVGVFSDNTFHKRAEEEFRKLANYDVLTGLPNRACLYDRLNQTIEKTKRDNGRFALFLIDVDNFKRINDSLGHNVGDILIRQVASRLVSYNKEGDTVARIGGDEFVIVLENVKSSSSVAAFSELLLKELNQPIFVKGQQLKLNFSIGVTLAPDDAIVAERLMRNADTAMYEAKKLVDNSYRFYSIEFNERAKKRLVLENALRKSIEEETFELYYQPKVDLNTGRVDGVEALARWTHKELGFVSPEEFIPLAEDTGLIIPLGRQLLRLAAKQTKSWVDQGIMRGRTSVNLSAHQFWNQNLVAEITEIMREVDLDTKYLELEITESACMQELDETINQMNTLQELGISLALDDFGTGYSSLSQLKALPLHTLKVDKSFVDNIETNKQDEKVVKAIIDIAKSMEMDVVIEGVESRTQCEYLWKKRAYIVQGYYFSRPVRPSSMPELFNKRWSRDEYLTDIAINVTPLG